MKRQFPIAIPPDARIAQLAVAQYLLFEATVESLAALGDSVARRREHKAAIPLDGHRLTEPFRVRYALFRRMLDEDRLH